MNSCLYECDVMHYRVEPKKYKFTHKTFMFYLDLDQLDDLAKSNPFFAHNTSGIFSFHDKDHLQYGSEHIRANIEIYLKDKGINDEIGRIMLLTNTRVFGYIFNPVCFYYCFDLKGRPLCVIAEICNTYKELKPFLMSPETFKDGIFKSEQKKYFYISPFIALDIPLDFQIKVPEERLDIRIDDLKENKKFLYTSLIGKRIDFNPKTLLWCGIKYPFLTLKTIFLIHYHAAILHFVKKVPHHKKNHDKHLQKGLQK